MTDKLTYKQQKFVDYYVGEAEFNATQAAQLAGYKGDRHSLSAIGGENLGKLTIKSAIEKKLKGVKSNIAKPEDVLEFFWKHMNDPEWTNTQRIRCAENLGKIFGMYIDRTKIEGKVTVEDTRQELRGLLERPELASQVWQLGRELIEAQRDA